MSPDSRHVLGSICDALLRHLTISTGPDFAISQTVVAVKLSSLILLMCWPFRTEF